MKNERPLLHRNSDQHPYAGRLATVMGLGRFDGGVAAARFLARQGARVTVTDIRSETELADSLGKLRDIPIDRFVLGGHSEEVFAECQLLIVNPAVRPDNPFVAAARSRGADVTTEIELFLRHNPAPVIAVTGTNGKSTTSALIYHLLCHSDIFQSAVRSSDAAGRGICEAPRLPTDPATATVVASVEPQFRAAPRATAQESNASENATGRRHVWLGGNIGISLLDQLDEIAANDLVVLELSSFQLELLRPAGFRPRIAVLVNFSPNHLDWHGTVAAYARAKQAIFDAQRTDDVAILPGLTDTGSAWRTRSQRLTFGLIDHGEDGAFLEDGRLILRSSRGELEDVFRLAVPSQLPGEHNRMNVAAAACAAWQAGADPQLFSEALKSFSPLPHRLQRVAEKAGRQFWNDSIATTPESAIMALRVFSRPVVLLAGGYDKGQDLSSLAEAIRARVRVLILMGQTSDALQKLVLSATTGICPAIEKAVDFPDAFQKAVTHSQPGDPILLSPGCASYGWFRDYRERGEQFTSMAQAWAATE